MELQILFDKDVINSKFKSGWGFSLFVDGVLFDTGESGPDLRHNLKEKGIDINLIELVSISHDHWDHTGGLWNILKAKKKLKIYGCPGFSQQFKDKVKSLGGEFIAVNNVTQIKEKIYLSGQMTGLYKSKKISEQVLILKLKEGFGVVTGCAHPGLINIVEKIKDFFGGEKIKLILGGFHLLDKEKRQVKLIAQNLKNLGVEYIGSAHCTGYQAEQIFKETFQKKYIPLKVGKTISL